MRNVTRTATGAGLQTARELGIPWNQPRYTSLNEIVRRVPGYVTAKEPKDVQDANNIFNPARDTQNMLTQYLAIGIGALEGKTVPNVGVVSIPVPHSSSHTGFYRMIPHVLIRVGAGEPDLTTSERARYRLRRHIVVNGEECVAYYLLKIDYAGVDVAMQSFRRVNGINSDPVDWQPATSDAEPVRPALPASNVLPNDGTYYAAVAPVEIAMQQIDLERMTRAVELLTGEPAAAVVSEYAMVAACERQVQVPGEGTPFTDVLGAQVQSFYVTNDPIYGRTELTKYFNVGHAEPKFGISS